MRFKTVAVTSVSALILGMAASAKVSMSDSGAAGSGKVGITVVAGPSPTPSPTPTSSTTQVAAAPKPITTQVAAIQVVALKPLDLTDMRLWNWAGKWHASEWANANGPIPWRYNHITQPNRADTFFRLDAAGAPQLQALNGTTAYGSGLWETDVTLPKMRDGLIVAPLWIYDTTSRDEVDFEFAGRKGLDVTLHAALNGVMQSNTVRLFAGVDMSGQRKRFGIKMDQAAGYVEMYVDSKLVHRWDRSKMSYFVSKPLKPWIEMWPANPANTGFVQWAGKWTGFATGETLTMTVHGYGYSPLVR